MKKYIALIFILFLASCNHKYEKPYIIVGKSSYNAWQDHYTFQDANGFNNCFDDDKGMYNIGDTLK